MIGKKRVTGEGVILNGASAEWRISSFSE